MKLSVIDLRKYLLELEERGLAREDNFQGRFGIQEMKKFLLKIDKTTTFKTN